MEANQFSEISNNQYETISENTESTVVSKYIPEEKTDTSYQSEADLEKEFIDTLKRQGYERLNITSKEELERNLRLQIEKLNNYYFTDSEWKNFFKKEISNAKLSTVDKTYIVQENYLLELSCDNGDKRNIKLFDKKNIQNNSLQVINQFENNDGKYLNRYDVTILVNGFPLVHIELKKRERLIKEAFNQIERYQRDSFWAGNGLYDFVQIFVISTGQFTKYYSNSTRLRHIENNSGSHNHIITASNSFEFTQNWADAENNNIEDLIDFTRTFLSRHSLLNILFKYCVFTGTKEDGDKRQLLVMRPYQIVATERIIQQIKLSNHNKTYGKIEGGGYIWHTTGSGKTLTSFKTSQLATQVEGIEKVLFVVDRKDLDIQTISEYKKFNAGIVEGSKNTKELLEKLNSPDVKIIVTTIQKLSLLLVNNKNSDLFNKRVVLIFDECHRSQFGTMHDIIVKKFKKYNIFGFTGTPIFAANSSKAKNFNFLTTEQAFGKQIHSYNIMNAINDKNVLPFKTTYISTMKEKENIKDEEVYDIDREKALASPERIKIITKYVLDNFDRETRQTEVYQIDGVKKKGFNSIFATASVDVCKKYYKEFKKQQEKLPVEQRLKIATIFSYESNENPEDLIDVDLPDDDNKLIGKLDQSSRDFLEEAIKDYNSYFNTNFDTSAQNFMNYYTDLSKKVKENEIHILIVVNMFLTGFDAKTLNTLWVDKNLRKHGLLQAFSRTNRILNQIKTFGNIVCFRNLEQSTNKSIALFGNDKAGGIVLIRPFKDYYDGYIDDDNKRVKGYKDLIEELRDKFSNESKPISETEKKEFINLFSSILRFLNILKCFEDFKGKEILTERELQNYQGIYNDLYDEFKKKSKNESTNINDDIVFEIELIKSIEINIDYILNLVYNYFLEMCEDKELNEKVKAAIASSMELRNKRELIEEFISNYDSSDYNEPISLEEIDFNFREFARIKRNEEIKEIIKEYSLNNEKTIEFMKESFKNGYVNDLGTEITKILPENISLFSIDNEYAKQKENVRERLQEHLDKFRTIISFD